MATTQDAPLEADDSTYEDDAASSAMSLRESIFKYRTENGRRYHAYSDGVYSFPNDDDENDRLDLQHHLWALTMRGKLFLAPLAKPHSILDVGTGTGIWALDFADAHPESVVVGVDLSPIQPSWVPPNLSFQIDDIELDWNFNTHFDFVYSRMMIGSLADISKFIKQSFENLNPGGYIELAELCFPVQIEGDEFPKDSALLKWSALMAEAAKNANRPVDGALSYGKKLKEAGFVDVVETKLMWPSNTWPEDEYRKTLGLWELENMRGGLEGLSIALFTRFLDWKLADVTGFCAEVFAEMKDKKLHTFWDIVIVYGKKPEKEDG